MNSPLGPLYLIANDLGICGIEFRPFKNVPMGAQSHLGRAQKELNEFFKSRRKSFTMPLALEGTPFQKKIWNELLKIPFGETVSYQQVAQRIGNPRAFRAVGTAIGKNPISIVIPCHRVVNASGELGGYAWGLHRKRKILKLEQTPVLITSA